jgi:single-strand DNA-binding protein
MASKNHVILGGNLTRDPETHFTTDKTLVATFGLAVTRPAPKGQDNGTDFFPVQVFGRLAELVAERKKKGDAVVVEGRVDYSAWEAQDGSRRNQVRVKADDIQFVDTIGNGVNIAVLIGNLTRDPESRDVTTGSGEEVAVCSFGLAMNWVRSQKDDAVDFVDVDVWREQGRAVQANKKRGHGVMVVGRLRQDSWKAEDDSPRSKVKVVADSVQFTTKNGSGSGSANGSARSHRGSHTPAASLSSDGVKATRAQVDRLRRDVTKIAGDDGVAMAEQRLGKALGELTKEEASWHIESLEKTGKLAVS